MTPRMFVPCVLMVAIASLAFGQGQDKNEKGEERDRDSGPQSVQRVKEQPAFSDRRDHGGFRPDGWLRPEEGLHFPLPGVIRPRPGLSPSPGT